MDFIIRTGHLTLRPFNEKDAPILHSISNQTYILKWMPDWKFDVEGTARLIQYYVSQYPLADKDTAKVMFAVELDGGVIGMVGVGNKEEVDNEIEIA